MLKPHLVQLFSPLSQNSLRFLQLLVQFTRILLLLQLPRFLLLFRELLFDGAQFLLQLLLELDFRLLQVLCFLSIFLDELVLFFHGGSHFVVSDRFGFHVGIFFLQLLILYFDLFEQFCLLLHKLLLDIVVILLQGIEFNLQFRVRHALLRELVLFPLEIRLKIFILLPDVRG